MAITPRKYSIFIISALIVPAFAVLLFNIYIDPFQILHKDSHNPNFLFSGRGVDRYQHAGIINQYDIKSIVIGNSWSANYLPSLLKKRLAWEKAYSLTMDGLPFYGQAIVAKRALSKHEVEHVLWGINMDMFTQPWDRINSKMPLKSYLYDNRVLNDLRFFLTFDLLKYHSKKIIEKKKILSHANPLIIQNKMIDRNTAWYFRRACDFNRPIFVAEKILKKNQLQYNKQTQKKLAPIKKQKLLTLPVDELPAAIVSFNKNMQNNLLPLIVQNPETEYHFVITPLPSLLWQRTKLKSKKKYTNKLQLFKHFVLAMSEYKNVKIYDFRNDSFTNDLRLYKDRTHFHIAVNDYILEQISQANNLIDRNTIDSYILKFDEKISNYRLKDKWFPKQNGEAEKGGSLSFEVARQMVRSELFYQNL